MRERPILMSAPMVRAILAGTKTQTRRVVKSVGRDDGFVLQDYGSGWWPYRSDDGESPMKGDNEIPHSCPYGKPGDRLWVRETFHPDPPIDSTWASTAWHGCPEHAQLSEIPERYRLPKHCIYRADWTGVDLARWRPSIHMPRWASRITLEVTGVRVERLQDISEADAIAEGIERRGPGWRWYSDAKAYTMDPRTSYRDLWESINGSDSWAANPWVWVVEFKCVTP